MKNKQKELKDAVVGDYVHVTTGISIGGEPKTVIREVRGIDGEGDLKRIFIEDVVQKRKEWRRGFSVKDGKRKEGVGRSYRQILRFATDEEVKEHLAKIERSERESAELQAHRNRPEAIDASFILSCTDEQLIAVGAEKLAEFAMLIRGVTAHADTPRKMDGDDDEDFGDVTK